MISIRTEQPPALWPRPCLSQPDLFIQFYKSARALDEHCSYAVQSFADLVLALSTFLEVDLFIYFIAWIELETLLTMWLCHSCVVTLFIVLYCFNNCVCLRCCLDYIYFLFFYVFLTYLSIKAMGLNFFRYFKTGIYSILVTTIRLNNLFKGQWTLSVVCVKVPSGIRYSKNCSVMLLIIHCCPLNWIGKNEFLFLASQI